MVKRTLRAVLHRPEYEFHYCLNFIAAELTQAWKVASRFKRLLYLPGI